MPTSKISDNPVSRICQDHDHLPPAHVVLPPGNYEHVCSGCGDVTRFSVEKPTWSGCDGTYVDFQGAKRGCHGSEGCTLTGCPSTMPSGGW